jgi:hypothetical protein
MAAQKPQIELRKETQFSPNARGSSGPDGANICKNSLNISTMIDNLNKIVTTLAVIVAGIWTYKLFVENREAYARANLQHNITVVKIEDGRRLLRLDIIIENTGNVVLPLQHAEVRVERVLPLSPRIEQTLDQRVNQIVDGQDFFPWPVIRVRQSQWEEGQFELEPGEQDNARYEFIIPSTEQVINIYTHFDNAAKQDKQPGIGWDHSTLIDLRSLDDPLTRRESDD